LKIAWSAFCEVTGKNATARFTCHPVCRHPTRRDEMRLLTDVVTVLLAGVESVVKSVWRWQWRTDSILSISICVHVGSAAV